MTGRECTELKKVLMNRGMDYDTICSIISEFHKRMKDKENKKSDIMSEVIENIFERKEEELNFKELIIPEGLFEKKPY